MAPVPFIHPIRYPPLLLAAGHLLSIVYLTYAVGVSLYTSYKSLGPVSNTRSRIQQRRKLTRLFFVLAITAFTAATYYSTRSAILSYKTWAYEHGLDLTQRLFGEDGSSIISDGQNSRTQYITQWLSDTPIYLDALEIVAEKARRFWWGQQIDLGTTAFSLILATEGRRRNIPLPTAFLALAHLVNLSFAQNLFFLALLLTPSPLPPGDRTLELPVTPLSSSPWTRFRNKLMAPKPTGWAPSTTVFYAAILLNFGLVLILPYAAGTSSFTEVALLARLSTFLPVLLPKILPVRWGSVQQRPHGAYESLTKLFKFLSAAAFALHAKMTLVALLSNAPDSHYHRHSALLPWDVEERSRRERSSSAFAKVLGSTSDHPAVAAVGADVILCALSLGLWAAVRGLNARDVMTISIPFCNSDLSRFKWSSPEKGELRDDVLNFLEAESDHEHEHEHEHEPKTPANRRSKTPRQQRRLGSIASSSGASEESSTPSSSSSSRRRRGPPRKAKPIVADDTDDEPSPSPSRRVARRQQQRQRTEEKEKEEDGAYVPTPATARLSAALEGDGTLPPDPDWESASLAWALAAFGGLASACAGVFGGECVSR
ncbi:hypothetical protein F5Y10DRAFT_53020 [Nemania abortiva]|nr:hypothetical protein F5Y10DRAFT_53020 [Nemania abortiva]